MYKMMLRFSVCPHDIEKGGLDKWKAFAKDISKALNVEVGFEPLLSFEEERDKLVKEDFFDLYYANPFSAVELYLKGYRPVAKLRGQKDRYFIFYRELPQRGPLVLATALLRPVALLALQLDISRVEIDLCKSWQEVLKKVEEGKAHAGIIYEDIWQELTEERRKGFSVLDGFIFESSHVFMAKREYETLLSRYFSTEEYEPAEETLRKLLKLYEEFERFYELWTKVKAFALLERISGVGIILYWEKGIAFMNDYALEVLEYTKEELSLESLEKVIDKIVHPSQKDAVLQIARRRIKGEQFVHNYGELVYRSKRGRKIYTYTYSITVPYGDNSYGGLVIFVDITKKKRLEALYQVLRDINLSITTSLFEEELFERVSKSLLENLNFEFLTIFRLEPNSAPQVYRTYPDREKLPEELLKPAEVPEDVYIEPNTGQGSKHCKLAQIGVFSFCSIPLKTSEGRLYLLNLYSSEPYFFEEENRELLYELKHDLEFALQRLYDWRKAFIIKSALDRSSTWLVVTDRNGIITYVNDAVCRITGYSREELLGKKTSIFRSGFHDKSFYEELWNTIRSGKEFNAVFVNRKKNGETFYIEQHIYPLELPGGVIRYVSIGRDITREVELSEEVKKLSRIDPMTGLLNRETFEGSVETELSQVNGKKFAFLLVDLYGTGAVNQKLGTRAGDLYIQAFAKLLRKEFSDAKFVGRLYGDKFGILMPVEREEDVFLVQERLFKLMDMHVDVGESIPLSFNAGIALYPVDGKSFSELYSKAKLALYKAKALGEGKIVIVDEKLENRSEDYVFSTKLVIKRAIEEELFVLYFQPYFDIETLELRGFEALVRIVDKDGTVYRPAYFIDYLERSRYLKSFEGWLIREAINSAEKLKLRVSVNLSANTLRDDSLLKMLLSLPSLPLTIEITERTMLELGPKTLEMLELLRREKGVKIAMDDFGTGYSTLSHLIKLPVDILKIDYSFVKEIIQNKRIRAIVRNTIALARDLGIITLAEGIETEPQLRMLQGMGCDLAQGFLLGKPMTFEEALKHAREKMKRLK